MVRYGMVPLLAPSVCSSLRAVASCSVHPVSEQHRQAVQSALVRRWVRPCDAGIGKEWNRGCLHETKSSGILLRCTCLALPATRSDRLGEQIGERRVHRKTIRTVPPCMHPPQREKGADDPYSSGVGQLLRQQAAGANVSASSAGTLKPILNVQHHNIQYQPHRSLSSSSIHQTG
jgi:hypothetical protein